jgi:hypothetical protein
MFTAVMDEVMAEPEIKGALDEFRLTPQNLRGRMVTAAARVLQAAPLEFAAYEAARDDAGGVLEAGSVVGPVLDAFRLVSQSVSLANAETVQLMRWIARGAAACGVLLVTVGAATMSAWPQTAGLLGPGAAMLCLAGLVYGTLWLGGQRGQRLLRGTVSGPEAVHAVEQARDQLMAALTSEEMLAQARLFINTVRYGQFGHDYSVTSIAGLSETYDATYQVSTRTAAELKGLLDRLDGASIGVAGSRGSGKSTLIRWYCEDTSRPLSPTQTADGALDLRCMVSAPVDYAPRDFVLHLFAAFCRAVIQHSKSGTSRWRPAVRPRAMIPSAGTMFYLGLAAALVYWQRPVAGAVRLPVAVVFWAGIAAVLLADARIAAAARRNARWVPEGKRQVGASRTLAAKAKRHLAQVRYLQTRTAGWSGTFGMATGTGGLSFTSSRAEQPRSYPEVVGEFRGFARSVAADVHANGHSVFIGIDELDKIGKPEQAEQFLNEIKGIFGIPHVYFMVSVSDDALSAFERRGLPLRDAFDSSFDEIIEVDPLTYPESRRLLYRRVIGLTEPFVALCHCLSGGLARDLIRAARQVTRAAQTLSGGPAHLPDEHDEGTLSYLLPPRDRARPAPVLSSICTAVVTGDLRRKFRAVALAAATIGQAVELQQTLSTATRCLQADPPTLAIVDLLSQAVPDEPGPVTALRLELAAYAYYCTTLQDVFGGSLDTERIAKATTSADPGSFDALAAARLAFTLDPHIAWQSITEFRKAWALDTRTLVSAQ